MKTSGRLRVPVGLLSLVMIGTPGVLRAQIREWAHGNSGNWSVPVYWNPTGVPQAGNLVYIRPFDGVSRTILYDYAGAPITLGELYIDLTGGSENDRTTLTMASGELSTNWEEIGIDGRATVDQSGGDHWVNGDLSLGVNFGSDGVYNLSDGTLNTGWQYIGFGGAGAVHQTGGVNHVNGTLTLGEQLGSFGSYSLGGNGELVVDGGSTWVGHGGSGSFDQNGGLHDFETLVVASFNATGTYSLSGGTLVGNSLAVGESGGVGSLTQTGGEASAGVLTVGAGGHGTYDLEGGSAQFGAVIVQGDFSSSPNAARFTVDGGDLTVNGSLQALDTSNSRIELKSGSITTDTLDVTGDHARFVWTGGTLSITGAGGLRVGATGPLGHTTLGTGKQLNVSHMTRVDAGYSLAIAGGSFWSNELENSGVVLVQSSTATIESGLYNKPSGLFSVSDNVVAVINGIGSSNEGEIRLGGGTATLMGSGELANFGIIRGDGYVFLPTANHSGGEIRAEAGKRVVFAAGLPTTSSGRVVLQGGTAEFTSGLVNSSGGQVLGRGTLVAGGSGLSNQGQVTFSGGMTDVFGDVTNDTGSANVGITVAGNADVFFWDDVDNLSGLFKVNAGSTATFFGAFSGNGISGNAEDIVFEGPVNPGLSPAAISLAGNARFGGGALLTVELGGLTQGAEYDHVEVLGELSLDGILKISLIDEFTPHAGDLFDILDWSPGGLSGEFAAFQFPSLSGGLSWDTSELYTQGLLSVIGGEATDGDLNDDGNIDAVDIDILWHIVRNGGADPNDDDAEDLNGDSFLNENDVDYMLANLLDAGPNRQYGDADLDGGVGGLDFTAWRLRAGTGWANGDFDGDGGIGGLDFTLWRTRPSAYPGIVGPHSGAVATVPEPASGVLFVTGLVGVGIWVGGRRRKS